jgi:hypothetical protein
LSIADNPFVIGIAGPDLPKWDRTRVDRFRKADPSTAGRQRYGQFLSSRYGTDIDRINLVYGTQWASVDDLNKQADLKFNITSPEAKRDDELFLAIVADALYRLLREATQAAAPKHLFFGEKFYLRSTPDTVLKAIGPHVDVFSTQALILSPQRPPEWQVFQGDAYDREQKLVGKPMVIIDWAAPFSVNETFESSRGTIKDELAAAEDAAQFLQDAFQRKYMLGVWKCQLIGLHPNDRWFEGKAKRTYVQNDGADFPIRTEVMRQAHRSVLQSLYQEAAN